MLDARFTITGPSETNGFVNALPMLHTRFFPSIEQGNPPSMDELVTMKSYDWEGSGVWTGDAELTFGPSPVEELEYLAPVETIASILAPQGPDPQPMPVPIKLAVVHMANATITVFCAPHMT